MGRKKRAEALGNKVKEQSYNPYTHGQAEQLLPAVGEKLRKTPAYLDDDHRRGRSPRDCIVVEVNPLSLWFRVRFVNSGLHQCFKVPEI